MNLTHGKGWMSTAASSAGWRSGDVVSDEFPVGLRVLVVDDDPTCLMILERMLRACLYEVTKCQRAEEALSLLRGIKNRFDIVLSDVHMPDMDGFKLLEHIGLEMELPVIMMSVDDGKHVVMKGITHGACDYLIKPIRMEALKNIWQHVVRKRRGEWRELEHSGSFEDGDRLQKQAEEADYSSSANEGSWRNPKRRKEEEEEVEEERDDSSALKKPRVVWSVELHQQFVGAVKMLGIDKAVPKKILELMNVPGLSRENVASHLQKYRLYLRRLSGVSQHQSNSFISSQEATFAPISSINDFDLQAFAVTGQLPPNIVTFQVPGISQFAIKSETPMPLVDQRNVFSFENPNPNPKLRFVERQHQNLSINKPVTSIHGLPAHNLHNTVQSSAILSCNIVTRPPPSAEEPLTANGGGNVLGRNRSANSGRGTENSLPPDSIIINFPMNRPAELPSNGLSLQRATGVSDLRSTGRESVKFEPSFDIFNDLHGFSLNSNASQHINSLQDCLQVSPLVHREIPTAQKNSSSFSALKAPFSSEEGTKQRVSNHSGELGSILVGNSTRVGDATCRTGLISNHFGQEDLMTAILKQQQDIGTGEDESDFDGYFYL